MGVVWKFWQQESEVGMGDQRREGHVKMETGEIPWWSHG